MAQHATEGIGAATSARPKAAVPMRRRLATARLPIGKHGRVVPIKKLGDHGLGDAVVHGRVAVAASYYTIAVVVRASLIVMRPPSSSIVLTFFTSLSVSWGRRGRHLTTTLTVVSAMVDCLARFTAGARARCLQYRAARRRFSGVRVRAAVAEPNVISAVGASFCGARGRLTPGSRLSAWRCRRRSARAYVQRAV